MLGETLLNRYRLDALLGQGGMGIVYHGYDLLLRRAVAVKVLSKTALGTAGRARLLSEAQAAAGLNHPNIVTVYDAGETGDIPFIVMELVSGQTLRQYAPSSLAEALEITSQVCAALEHAHSAGVIHRDLKLENVVVTPVKTIKLMDFGLARSRASPRLTEDGALMGTFLYMAPELLMGQEASVQSDLYALGVMTYELACGQPPFKGDDPLALISQHLHATPVPPSTHNPAIPLGVETLILKLLSKQPGDRPASAAEVRLSLATATRAGEIVVSTRTPLDRMVRGRLVGRERELAEAAQIWEKARQGESSILLISGEPGVGKTRLAREMIVRVQMEHGVPLAGECYVEGSAPYAAFAQMILNVPDWPTDLPQLVLADLISLAPALRVRYADVPLNPRLEPMAEQQRLYECAFTFFARLAGRAPLLLVLEDAHWADGGTLALARSLARRFRQTQTPVLVVLTYREGELTQQNELSALLTSWNRERMANSIKLRRLDRQGTRDMLEALFAESVTADFADGVYRETEGNPFFIEEMCKALIEGGQVYRENGRWQRRSTSSIEMPRSIRMAIETRLSGLSETTQEALHLAAVLGRRFEFNVLRTAAESIAGQDEDALIAALEAAEQAQLLAEVGREGGGTFEFAHALIPTTLVEGISGMRRRRLHGRAIAALEKLRPEDYKALAHHCLEANQDQRALDFMLKAAQRARATFANAEAVANYQQAIGLLSELRHEPAHGDRWQTVEPQLYEDLGDVLELTGQYEEARDAYRDALARIPDSDRVWQSRLYRNIGNTWKAQRRPGEAQAAYDQANATLDSARAETDSVWQQESLEIALDRMNAYYLSNSISQMQALAENLSLTIQKYGTPIQRARFFFELGNLAMRQNRYRVSEDMLRYAQTALAASQEANHKGLVIRTTFHVGFGHLWRGNWEQAEAKLQAARELAEQIGDTEIMITILTWLTVTYRRSNQLEQVRHYAERCLQAATVSRTPLYIGLAQANQAWVAWRDGNLTEAQVNGRAALALLEQGPAVIFCKWLALVPLVDTALKLDNNLEAIEYARVLLHPTQMHLAETLEEMFTEAVKAWDGHEADKAHVLMQQAVEMAQQTGWM